MTMPALIGSAKKRETVSKLQKSYNVLSQLVIRAQEDNGPVSFPSGKLSADVAETFFKLYWIPYFNSPTVVPDGQDFKTEDGRTGFIYKSLMEMSMIPPLGRPTLKVVLPLQVLMELHII